MKREKGIIIEEKRILSEIDKMCTESLPPEIHSKWELVKQTLIGNRHLDDDWLAPLHNLIRIIK